VAERPVTAKELRLILAGPDGVCARPPGIATIRNWVSMGLPYVTVPGQTRKMFLASRCAAWVKRKQEAD
jgi:hypothetical protein